MGVQVTGKFWANRELFIAKDSNRRLKKVYKKRLFIIFLVPKMPFLLHFGHLIGSSPNL